MNLESARDKLEREWELETGFFGRLRLGVFEPDGADRVISILQSLTLEVENAEFLDRRLVSLTWFIPRFMSYQREWMTEGDDNVQALDDAINAMEAWILRMLGAP